MLLHRFFVAVFISSCNTRVWTGTAHCIDNASHSPQIDIVQNSSHRRQISRVSIHIHLSTPSQLNNRKPSSVRHQRLKEPSNRSTSTQPGCDASDRSRSAMHSLNLYLYKRRPRWHGRGAAAAVAAEELVEDEGNIHPVSRMFVCVQAVRRRGRSPSHTTPSNSCNCDALAGWLALLHYMISPPGGEYNRRRASHTTTTPVAARHGAREPNEITNVFTRSFQEPNLRRSCSSTHLTLPRIPPAACIGLRFVIY